MYKFIAVLVAVAIVFPISTSTVLADPPDKAKREARKEQMKNERERMKLERKLDREERKRQREMEREDPKDREEMEREEREDREETEREDRKRQEDAKREERMRYEEEEGEKSLEDEPINIYQTIKGDLSEAIQEAKKTYELEQFQKDWQKTKRELTGLLKKLGLAEYVYKYLGDPDKRYIQVARDGKEIYSETGKKVTASTRNERKYAELITGSAKVHGVPEARIYAVIRAESGFNAKAVSPAGAMGLMQLMPKTAKELGVRDPFNPKQNINGGTKYLAMLYAQYENWTLAHAAYNAGPGNVKKYGGKVPPFKETKTYVARVNSYHAYYDKG